MLVSRDGATYLQRLTIFAKGNVDVRDTLIAHRAGGAVAWNGINEVLRSQAIPATVRIRHETFTRSDALAEARGQVPAELDRRGLRLGSYPASSQFSRAIFETQADAFVLSIQPDLNTLLLRHRRDGFLLLPRDAHAWDEEDRAWLKDSFVPCGLAEPAQAMQSLGRIVQELRDVSPAPILVYNVSSVTPGESIHCYEGLGETVSTRVKRFNLELVELSRKTGISVIDVDRIVARTGADRCQVDQLHLGANACRAVAEEVVRVLVDLDVLPAGAQA